MHVVRRIGILMLFAGSCAGSARSATPAFSLPSAAREQLLTCSGANLATALLSTDKAEHANRMNMVVSFSVVILDAGETNQQALKDEVFKRSSEYLDRQKADPAGAKQILDECDAIVSIGVNYANSKDKS